MWKLESLPTVPVTDGCEYVGVSFDREREAKGRRFRVVVYAGYAAYGLIGTERNGILLLDLDQGRILCDEIEREGTGWGGPSAVQIDRADWLASCSDADFVKFVNAHPRSRYHLEA